ncbi:MAG: hypothetical protein LC729_02325 [Acidobacteria bacterium]|nr:hypothetical protein [Acidobacteriota bacterium]
MASGKVGGMLSHASRRFCFPGASRSNPRDLERFPARPPRVSGKAGGPIGAE